MTTSTREEELPAYRGTLGAAFVLIIVGFAVASLVSLANMRRVRVDTRSLVAETITSIELVARMARDSDQVRLLITDHIREQDAHAMNSLEQQIAETDADLAAAARAYEPIVTNPGERLIWEELRQETEAVRLPIAHVLDLSRTNHDAEARAAMVVLKSRFDAIARAVQTLNQLNHHEAERLGAEIDSRQQWAMSFLFGLSLGWGVLAFLLAGWVMRILARKEAQVRGAFSRLEQQNRELDAFAGKVAHDVRGPLTTIRLATSRLAEQLPHEAGTFAIFERGVARMEGMIEDLLTLSRVDVQAPDVSSETAVVATAVEQDLGRATADVGGQLHIDLEPATVHCSEGLLRQALYNLGENAVKYRRVDVPLDLRIVGRIVRQCYELRVSDSGTGMSPNEVIHAFDPFFRSEGARSQPGTGLGLTIVARIVQASRGTVSIDSQVGRGSTFVIRMPLASSAASGTELFPVAHPT